MAVNRQKIWQINFYKYNAVGGGLKCCHPLNYKNATVNHHLGFQLARPSKLVLEAQVPKSDDGYRYFSNLSISKERGSNIREEE